MAMLDVIAPRGVRSDAAPVVAPALVRSLSPLRQEHEALRVRLADLAAAAARIGRVSPVMARLILDDTIRLVMNHLIPHAAGEHAVTRALMAGSPVKEVAERTPDQMLAATLAAELGTLRREPMSDATCDSIQRVLYGLHAVFSIHFADGDVESPGPPLDNADVFARVDCAQRDANARAIVRSAWRVAWTG